MIPVRNEASNCEWRQTDKLTKTCIHCRTKKKCISFDYLVNATKETRSCCQASNSLQIAKDILQNQPAEVRNAVHNLRITKAMGTRGYTLCAANDKLSGGETKSVRMKTIQSLPASKHDFKSNPALEGLNEKHLTGLHLKQIGLYNKIGKDLVRLSVTREDRAEEAARRCAREAEKADLREKLKETAIKKVSLSEESNALKAEKRAERKERALAKKQREQAAKAEIKLNQAKLQSGK